MLQSWVLAMKRDQWKPSQYSFLCEKHFTPDDYVMGKEAENRLKKYLKPDAIPSVFHFPPHLLTQTNPRNPPKRQATRTVTGVPFKRPKKGFQPALSFKGRPLLFVIDFMTILVYIILA